MKRKSYIWESRNTGKQYTGTQKDWEAIKAIPHIGRNFKLISTGEEPETPPEAKADKPTEPKKKSE